MPGPTSLLAARPVPSSKALSCNEHFIPSSCGRDALQCSRTHDCPFVTNSSIRILNQVPAFNPRKKSVSFSRTTTSTSDPTGIHACRTGSGRIVIVPSVTGRPMTTHSAKPS